MAKQQIAVQDSAGLRLVDGCHNFGRTSTSFDAADGRVKTFVYSKTGSKFAFICKGLVYVYRQPGWQLAGSLAHQTAQELSFSLSGRYLAVWCIYVKDGRESRPNLHVYDADSLALLRSFTQQSQTNWEPQWTGDEKLLARSVGNEVHFYEQEDMNKIAAKRSQSKLSSFSLSPSCDKYTVVFVTPSVKGAPCFVHMYSYPKFQANDRPIANKSFYKVDTIEYLWNAPCTCVLLMTTSEKSAQSYYGEQMVFVMNTDGDSFRATFDKAGSISSIAWVPSGTQFFAVYGSAPARATLYDCKCNPVREFGEGVRNVVLVNPVGNLAMIGAFGNMSSRFEVWDISQGKSLCQQECPDITHIEWSPCGQYLITSTCTPRLRVNNGYKLWHYSGSLQYEHFMEGGSELYRAAWLPQHEATKPFTVSDAKVPGITTTGIKTASTQRYVPPSQRGAARNEKDELVLNTKKFLSQIDKYTPSARGPVVGLPVGAAGLPVGADATQAKSSQKKGRKRGGAGKKQKGEEGEEEASHGKPPALHTPAMPQTEQDKEKRGRALRKKLDAIKQLKSDQAAGKVLDKNQLVKIETEAAVVKELEMLAL